MSKFGPDPGPSGGGGRRRSSGNCVGCGKRDSGDDIDHWVRCDEEGCDGGGAWWHDKCAGVQAADYEGSARWSCPHCVKVSQMASLRDQQANRREEGDRSEQQVVVAEERVESAEGEEMFMPGGLQVEDEHGYVRRHEPPPPAPPPQSDLPPAHVAHTTHIPTATHIPKSCRGDYARVLADTVSASLGNPQDVTHWVKLQIISKCILRAKGRGESQTAQSFAAEVKLRIQRWRQGEVGELWKEAVKAVKAQKKGADKKGRRKKDRVAETAEEKQTKQNAERSTKLMQEGQFSRAAKALTSRGIDQHSEQAKAEMRAKHPTGRPTEIPAGDIPAPPIRISASQVKKAIKSFKKGTAPGPDGMRPEHLKEALAAVAQNRSSRFQSVLAALVNLLASGGVPEEVAPYLGGANMFAAKKKDGGYRPIAVGNTIRRLVSKCIAYAVAARAAAFLRPYQFGVGVRGGCEGIIHATRILQGDEEVPDGSKWLVQVDLQNAFNLVDRSKMFEEVRRHMPDISHWVESIYSVEAVLNLGDSTISSTTGVHQGDPLASLLFALALHPVIMAIVRAS